MRPHALKVIMIALLTTLLGACTLSMRYPDFAQLASKSQRADADAEWLMLVSYIHVKPGHRGTLADKTRKVLDDLPNNKGLLGFAARRQLLGNEAWTVSVWESEAALNSFIYGAPHSDAVSTLTPVLIATRFKQVRGRAGELPRNWDEALRQLAP